MSVYIDNMQAPFGRMKMCHMSADTSEELLAMADYIGVDRKWIQYPGTFREHFDICLAKRKLAIHYGAEEVTTRELVRRNMMKSERMRELLERAALAATEPPAQTSSIEKCGFRVYVGTTGESSCELPAGHFGDHQQGSFKWAATEPPAQTSSIESTYREREP